ncbi:hypothetical protein NQ315_011486 [Exocentrus adspersus]|uniref:Uncharacterized protein n=1 Tax=Exocentrus adspersus TaxID=1586481 RepID=A0AAV8VV68_9CUCU|nr:hypothetical protein NQ315_011486 [Exocentrus adspersus]
MPVKANYPSPCSKGFDFGVPLEDIFPPNDIHPRLKYLFEEAYKLVDSHHNIEEIVRRLQGPLGTRLELKQKIVHDVHYDIKNERLDEAPGAYFWIIRHFLGLLPIPLLPTYSGDVRFEWSNLSEKCRYFLQHYESERSKKYLLDYKIAENLSLLPFEHFLLLTILIHFVRRLSQKTRHGRQINRKSLLFLSKYYGASTCVRPYTPGYSSLEDEIGSSKNRAGLNNEQENDLASPETEEHSFVRTEKLYEGTEFTFNDDTSSNKAEWSDIVKETKDTVKKVEDYIYDDYDTFSKEEYNQISESKLKSRGSVFGKVSKIGWTYTPRKNRETQPNEDLREEQDEKESTYIKFEDVFDTNGKYRTNGKDASDDEFDAKHENGLNITFKKVQDSCSTPLFNYSASTAKKMDRSEGSRSKKNFNLKRFKINLDFFESSNT